MKVYIRRGLQTLEVKEELFGVREKHCWAALAIAQLHMREEMEKSGAWTCDCRSCEWAALHVPPPKGKGSIE